MILLIPLGGKGLRFKSHNYDKPKALIEVENKPIIFWLLDNLNFTSLDYNCDFIYIPYNYNDYYEYDFENLLINKYPSLKFKFLKLHQDTLGASHTINIALNELLKENYQDTPILSLDSDNFYMTDIINKWNKNNMIFTFNDFNLNNKCFSYINLIDSNNSKNKIKEIKEKERFENSNLASCGAYGFRSYKELYEYTSIIIKKEIKFKNEYYLSCVIQEMLNDSIEFNNYTIDNKDYFSLGTPEQLETFKYIFLFDLDGTLVDTDDHYINIWNNLLNKFNIIVDKPFFEKNIKGKSDKLFLKSLFPEIEEKDIKGFSKEKDELFLKNMENIKIFDGVIEFIQKLQNNRIGIVTSCNRIVAEAILFHFHLTEFINLIISSNDVIHHKPHKEPYITAIEKFGNLDRYLTENNFIVFEDSYSGYMSAYNASIQNIFIKLNETETENENENLINQCKVFNNYNELSFEKILQNNSSIDIIKNSISIPFKFIENTSHILKEGGYICQVYSYKIHLNNYEYLDIIIKKSNNNNSLSISAKELNLYQNEKYFYDNIAHKLDFILKIPKCYGTYSDDYNTSIILENLNTTKKGCFNINLNNNINLILNIINNISKLHTKFYYTSKEIFNDSFIKTTNDIHYYNSLISERYQLFKSKNFIFIPKKVLNIMDIISKNFKKITNILSTYPLSLCHGDVKSPNIFYENFNQPYFLDFQYINLNKGVSDIIFLLVESVDFNENICDISLKYYYTLILENNISYDYNQYLIDLQASLSCFPFFVAVWFNTEDINTLNDKSFPLNFLKNLIKYMNYLIEPDFIRAIKDI